MKIFILISFLVFYKLIAFSQSNLSSLKTISPNVYNEWKTLSNPQSTIDGKWISYEISPAKGDGFLYIYDTENGKLDSVSRGRKAKFSPDGSFLAFMIAPPYDSLRQMKLRKVDKKKLPKDSLGILILQNDSLIKLAKVKIEEARKVTLSPLTFLPAAALTDSAYLSRQLASIPVTSGDRIQTTFLGARKQDYKVVDTLPSGAVLLTPQTAISITGEGKATEAMLTYEDIGGLKKEIGKISTEMPVYA